MRDRGLDLSDSRSEKWWAVVSMVMNIGFRTVRAISLVPGSQEGLCSTELINYLSGLMAFL
jgi:hypothetical protein